MERSPYCTQAAVHLIEGRAGTGKTSRLIELAVDLLEGGAQPEELLLFAATPAAARALEGRLAAHLDAGAAPRVTTVPAFALALLGTPEAVAHTGRRGRVLLRFEENMLMEDLKTSGVAPRRLAEMVKFLSRSLVDLEPMEGSWFYDGQEEHVFSLMARHLRFREAYREGELPRAAWDYLSAVPEARAAASVGHVLVDDYQMLSRASQAVAGLLAASTLTAAGDPLARVRGCEDYPAYGGLEELAQANPEATSEHAGFSHLATVVADAVNRFAQDEALGAVEPIPSRAGVVGTCEACAFTRPEDELAGAAAMVAELIGAGTAPERIGVAAANRLWAGNMARALAARGIAVSAPARAVVAGDGRALDTCKLARTVTLLRLTADENDPLALRSWCGFGDYLANSALASAVVEGRARLSLACGAIFEKVPGVLLAQEAEKADAALERAREIGGRLASVRGTALFRSACQAVGLGEAEVPTGIAQAVSEAGDDADAAALCRAIEGACTAATFDETGVRVGLPEDFIGQNLDAMVMAGLVNGLTLPRRYFDAAQMERDKRPALLAAEMAKTYLCAGKAKTSLRFTYFSEAPLAAAESLQLKIHRVRLRDGERICEVRPSETIRAITGVYYHD